MIDHSRLILKLFTDKMISQYLEPTKLDNWFQPRLIKNSERRWFQFWKPRLVKNPKYDPTPRIVTVKRPVKQIVT